MTARLLSSASIAGHFVQARWRWATLRGPRLTRFQEQRARRIVAYAARHAPFYRRHWAGYDLRHWQALPLVDKQQMMAHFDTFNTRGIRSEQALAVALRAEQSRDFRPLIGKYTVGLSSGTSGHRGLFLLSATEQAAWAGTILARTIHRLRGPLRVAFFLRSNSNLYEQVGSVALQFRYIDLMTPLPEAIGILNQMAPHIVVGPPSLLGMLADAQEQGQLRLRLQRLISVAEVLEPQDLARLQAVFHAPVHQIYQCTEGLLAVSCQAGSLHIQEDIVALQFQEIATDADHNTMPDAAFQDDGTSASDPQRLTPIVTDLWRRTQPIIRYRLNDVLQLDHQPCTCGSDWHVISSIEGRSDDVCWFAGLDGTRRAFFPDTIRRMLLLASPSIHDYLAVQERDGHLRVHLLIAETASFDAVVQAVRRSIETTIAAYDCRSPHVDFEDHLPTLPVGTKRRRVIRTHA